MNRPSMERNPRYGWDSLHSRNPMCPMWCSVVSHRKGLAHDSADFFPHFETEYSQLGWPQTFFGGGVRVSFYSSDRPGTHRGLPVSALEYWD